MKKQNTNPFPLVDEEAILEINKAYDVYLQSILESKAGTLGGPPAVWIQGFYEFVAVAQRTNDMRLFLVWLNEPHVTANDALREDFRQLIKDTEQAT